MGSAAVRIHFRFSSPTNNMAGIDFYHSTRGSGCRTAIMTAKALGIEFNLKPLRISLGEQLKPEFLKINPQHTIPTIVDNGFVLWESRAIAVYLVEKYGNSDDHPLFPKDPQKRALINQRLYFELGTLYESYMKYYTPLLRTGKTGPEEEFKKVEIAFGFLNTFLEGQDYVAGDHLTLADIAILSTVSLFDITEYDFSKYANVVRWYANAKKVTPGWDLNWEGLMLLKEIIEPKLQARREALKQLK